MQFVSAPDNLKQLRREQVKYNDFELELQEEIRVLRDELKQMKYELKQEQDSNGLLKENNSKLQEEALQLQTQFEQVNKQLTTQTTLKQELQNAKLQNMKLEDEINRISSKLDNTQRELLEEKASKQITYNIKQVNTATNVQKSEELKLQRQLQDKTQALNYLQDLKRTEKEQLQAKIQQLKDQCQEFQLQVQQSDETMAQLDKENQQLRQQNTELKIKLESLEQLHQLPQLKQSSPDITFEVIDLRNKNLHHRQQIAQLEHTICDLNTQISVMKEKLQTAELLRHQKCKLENEIILLEQDNERLKIKNRNDLDEIRNFKQQAADTQQQLKDKAYELELKQLNYQQSLKLTNSIRSENQQLNQEIQELQQQIQELRQLHQRNEELHERDMYELRQKLDLKSLTVNQRIINQIPIQVRSPYQIPQLDKHYL